MTRSQFSPKLFQPASQESAAPNTSSAKESAIDLLQDFGFSITQSRYALTFLTTIEQQTQFLIACTELLAKGNDILQIYGFLCRGGLPKIQFINKMSTELKQLGFSVEQTYLMTSLGGDENIQKLIDSIKLLDRYHFTTNQLTQLTACCNGIENLEILWSNMEKIIALDINNDQLAKSLGHSRDRKKYKDELLSALKNDNWGEKKFKFSIPTPKRKLFSDTTSESESNLSPKSEFKIELANNVEIAQPIGEDIFDEEVDLLDIFSQGHSTQDNCAIATCLPSSNTNDEEKSSTVPTYQLQIPKTKADNETSDFFVSTSFSTLFQPSAAELASFRSFEDADWTARALSMSNER